MYLHSILTYNAIRKQFCFQIVLQRFLVKNSFPRYCDEYHNIDSVLMVTGCNTKTTLQLLYCNNHNITLLAMLNGTCFFLFRV